MPFEIRNSNTFYENNINGPTMCNLLKCMMLLFSQKPVLSRTSSNHLERRAHDRTAVLSLTAFIRINVGNYLEIHSHGYPLKYANQN